MYAFLILAGFFGGIAVLISLVVAIIRRKPKKPLLIALAVCFAALVVGGVMAPSSETKSNEDNADTESAAANDVTESAETTEGPGIEETLTTLAADSLKNKNVPISVVCNNGACVVHCDAPDDTAYFNEVDLVRSHISAYIKFCKAAYETGEVTSVVSR